MRKTTALSLLTVLVDEGVLTPAQNHANGYLANPDMLPIDAKLAKRAPPAIAWDGTQFTGLSATWTLDQMAAFPMLDVDDQLRKAALWCQANRRRAPTTGAARFLNLWLTKANAKLTAKPGRDAGRNAAAATMVGE